MRALLASAAALLLSGCWLGGDFFGPADARAIVPPGTFRGTGTRGSDPITIRIAYQPDGLVRLDEDGRREPVTLGFTPLAGRPGLFIFWLDGAGGRDGAFGLLRPEPDGSFTTYAPACHRTAELVRAFGVAPEAVGDQAACLFPDRATLEAALRRFSDNWAGEFPVHFTRVPNG
jgi:hypothetical protein